MKTHIVLVSFVATAVLVGCTSDLSHQTASPTSAKQTTASEGTIRETNASKGRNLEKSARQASVQEARESGSRKDNAIEARDDRSVSAQTQPAASLKRPRIPTPIPTPGATVDSVGSLIQSAPVANSFRAAPSNPVSSAVRMMPPAQTDRENYAAYDDSGVRRVAQSPVSTFSIDVDTGAYSNMRRFIDKGALPPENAVRVEELINYFDYDYPYANDGEHPFGVHSEMTSTPWNPETLLLRVGIRGEDLDADKDIPANLVFLVDVSGSMNQANKLSLVKQSLLMLTTHLDSEDKVSIVVYAGTSGVVLEPTQGNERSEIVAAIRSLRAGGGTNGGDGIRSAYQLATKHFISDGVNRVILATDGDFNVGTTSFDELKKLVERKRKSGVFLTTLGFGQGNYNDHLMEQLADSGNGNYAYIDSIHEARKVLVEEMQSTLYTIAKDVKIQVEFNPQLVDEYRLIGYENRVLAREDFNDDRVDAGDIGAGHTVTALYEIALKGSGSRRVDQLRYQVDRADNSESVVTKPALIDELAFIKLRYKRPDSNVSTLIEHPVSALKVSGTASVDLRFAAAVAGFGQLLRGGRFIEDFAYEDVLRIARDAKGADTYGYRAQFIALVETVQVLNSISHSHLNGAGKPKGAEQGQKEQG